MTSYIPIALGPLCLDDSEDVELASPRITELNPNTVAFEDFAAGARIDAALLHVKYGTFFEDPAVLIAFQCTFISPEHSRTRKADITVKFIPSDPSVPSKYPKIVHHQPNLQNGAPTDSAIHDTFHAGVTSQLAPAMMDVGGSREKSFIRMHHTTVRSAIIPHSNSRVGRQCRNTIIWKLSENEAQKTGVRIFRGAVIVKLPPSSEDDQSSQFYADFKIQPKQASIIRQMYASLVGKSNRKELLCFDSKTPFQADGLSDQLENIDLSELLKLPTIDALPPGY